MIEVGNMGHYLKFWGTRGSSPVSGAQYKQFGGNTSCLEVRYGSSLAIIDAGTGILQLGNQLLREEIRDIQLFFSHLHWDHVIGFPFFKPLYHPDTKITLWTPRGKGRAPKQLFEQLFAEEFFPVSFDRLQAKLDFRTIEPRESVEIGSLEIDFQPTHHPYATFGFAITTPREVIGYVSDNELPSSSKEGGDAGLAKFFQQCDLWVHEMQYTQEEHVERRGWGHSSPQGVLALLQKIRPARWLVTHHDPDHSDRDLKQLERRTKKLLKENRIDCPVEWVADGTVIELKE